MDSKFSIEVQDVIRDISAGVSVKLVELRGKMDMLNSPAFSRQILPFIDQGYRHFIINMEELEYIDSAGIYALLQCYTRIKEKKGYLRLVGLNKNIAEVLGAIGVTKILPVYKTIEEALNA